MKILFILLSLLSLNGWSKVNLEIVLNANKIKQGEIASGKMIVNQSEGQTALSGLNGLNLDETIYLLNVSPFIGKNGVFEAQVKVIFLKVPESSAIKKEINGEEVTFQWSPLKVIPTEEPKSFLFGEFEIPDRAKYVTWLIGISSSAALLLLILLILRFVKKKKGLKDSRKKMLTEIASCQTYEDIVMMWRKKQHYLLFFPELSNDFKSFENVLFKYQFKPSQTESEVEEVSKAYDEFRKTVTGLFNGI